MLYILNLYNIICELYPSKTRRKKDNDIHVLKEAT